MTTFFWIQRTLKERSKFVFPPARLNSPDVF
jgi:hypothetical protein